MTRKPPGIARQVLAREQAFSGSQRSQFASCCYTDWFVRRLRQEHVLDWHGEEVTALDFSVGGELLASGSQDTTVGLWNWSAARLVGSYASGHVSNVVQVKILDNNPLAIATSSTDGSVRFGSAESSAPDAGRTRCVARAARRTLIPQLKRLPGSSDIMLACAVSGQVFCIDLRRKTAVDLFAQHHLDSLYCLDVEPTKAYALALGSDGFAHLFDLRFLSTSNAELACFTLCTKTTYHSPVTSVAFTANGSELLASFSMDNLALFSVGHQPVGSGLPIKLYKGHANNLLYGAAGFFGQHSDFVFSGSSCGSCMVWNKETAHLVQALPCTVNPVHTVCVHPRCPILATTAEHGTVSVWCPTARKPVIAREVRLVAERNRKYYISSEQRNSSYQQELLMLRSVFRSK